MFRARSRARAVGHPLPYPERYPFATAPRYYAAFCEDPDRMKLEVVARAKPAWGSPPTFTVDRDWLHAHVSRLSDAHEAAEPALWAVADAPADYVERQLGAIVGVEIPIEQLLGKWRTSQNRSHADRVGVVAGLRDRGDAESAELVERHATR